MKRDPLEPEEGAALLSEAVRAETFAAQLQHLLGTAPAFNGVATTPEDAHRALLTAASALTAAAGALVRCALVMNHVGAGAAGGPAAQVH